MLGDANIDIACGSRMHNSLKRTIASNWSIPAQWCLLLQCPSFRIKKKCVYEQSPRRQIKSLFFLPRHLHEFNILINQYRPSTHTLIISLQGLGIRILITKIQKAPPLIQCDFTITFILCSFEKFTKGLKTMGGNASSRDTHFQEVDDQFLIQGFVCPGSIELEAKLIKVTKLFTIQKTRIQPGQQLLELINRIQLEFMTCCHPFLFLDLGWLFVGS
mmetsp:Transcript_21115/g.38196  ORF Transcript_21115/g.38196 Transcript_21115/m.38196 type:complete len:217 (+) Transcript_21115:52-702(+)